MRTRSRASRCAHHSPPARERKTEGAVYLELLVVFFPIFFIFLGVIQMAFLYAAKLTVQHAALLAARAAIVVLDDEPKYYGGAPRNCLLNTGETPTESPLLRIAENIKGKASGDSHDVRRASREFERNARSYRNGGARLQAIRAAAYFPLLAVAPDAGSLWGEASIGAAIGTMPMSRIVSGLFYNLGAVAVTFPDGTQPNGYKTQFGPEEPVTVRVTYMFHCGIPGAAWLMCHTWYELMSGLPVDALLRIKDRLKHGTFSLADLHRWNREIQEEQKKSNLRKERARELQAAASPIWQGIAGAAGARFVVLQSEATLPNHGATYRYRDEDGQETSACEEPKTQRPQR
jgi:hypothetical protein